LASGQLTDEIETTLKSVAADVTAQYA